MDEERKQKLEKLDEILHTLLFGIDSKNNIPIENQSVLGSYKKQGNSRRNILNDMRKSCYSIKQCNDNSDCSMIKTCKNIDLYNFLEFDNDLANRVASKMNERIDNSQHPEGALTDTTVSSCIRRLRSIGGRIKKNLEENQEVNVVLENILGRKYINGFENIKSEKQFDEYTSNASYAFPNEEQVIEFMELTKIDATTHFIVCLMYYIGLGAQQICEIMPGDIQCRDNKYYITYVGHAGKRENTNRFNLKLEEVYCNYLDSLKRKNKVIEPDKTLIRNKFNNDFNVRGIGNIIVKFRKHLKQENNDITSLILRDVGIARKYYLSTHDSFEFIEYLRMNEEEYKKGEKLAKSDEVKRVVQSDIKNLNRYHFDWDSKDDNGCVKYYENNSSFNIIRNEKMEELYKN